MHARKRQPAPYKPAIEGASAKDKGVVVSIQRFRWKAKHDQPSENMIRMVRFVWMRRDVAVFALHGGLLGACMRAGLLWRRDDVIHITRAGMRALHADRRSA
jgi:hypothetical protein